MHKAQPLLGPWLNERATLAPHTRAYADSRIHGLTHAHSHLARVRPHAIHNNARKHHHSHQHTFTTHTHTHTVGKIVGLVGASMDAGKDGKDADPLSDLVTALRHIGGTTTGANALLAQACR